MDTEKKAIKNFIGGDHAEPADGRTYDLVNPSTGEVFAQAPLSGEEDVDRAFGTAAKAFEVWRDMTPSERQLALLRIADALKERGEEFMRAELAAEFLPVGVFNVVCGDRDTGRALVEHPTPQMVSITGSVRAGMEVARSAANDLKRTHLELGGKAPIIVFDDADIEQAAEEIATAGYFNAGQDCTAATRVLAAPGIQEDFVAALTEQAKNTKTGAPDDEGALYGPLNNSNQLEHVSGMVDRLPDHAEISAGGQQIGEKGYFYAPTVVSGLRQDDEATQNEIFGPVITVQNFSDEDEAVRWANGVKYGLASSVFTKDHGRAMRVSLRVRLDQHAHPARRRDAPRRLQALRPRQGPLDVRPRRLHPHKARNDQHRGLNTAT